MANAVLQILAVSEDKIRIFFDKVPGDVASVNLYLSLTDVTGNYVQVKSNIPNIPARPRGDDQVNFELTLVEVQALGAPFDGVSFANTPLFLRATEVSAAGVESAIASALTRAVGVVGVTPGYVRDNPVSNAHNYGYSPAASGWARVTATALGALSTSAVEYYEDNWVIDRTIDTGNVVEELIYRASDPSGAYAKKIVYTAPFSTDGKATKVEYQDAVKP